MESENKIIEIINSCIKQNGTFQDAYKIADFLIKCDNCRRIIWLAGIQYGKDMLASGEIKLEMPSVDEIITIISNSPKIQALMVPCGNEMFGYYKGMSENDKTEFKNKMRNILSCIVVKIFSGEVTPADLPVPTGIELPDGFPFPSDIPGMDDVINKGTEIFNKGMENLDSWMKQTGGGQFPKI